jgi:exoribonuclease-2
MDDDSYSGRFVLFFHHGELASGFCTAHSGPHVHLLCAGNLSMRLALQRVVHAQPCAGLAGRDPGQILEMLSCVEQKQTRLAETIDPETLWSKCGSTPCAYSPGDLARALFGDEAGDDHAAAVIRALQHDRIFFKFDGSRYLVRSAQQVEQARVCAAEEKARRLEIEQCAGWLHACVNGLETSGAVRDLCVDYVRQFAVFGTGAQQHALIHEIFKQAGFAPDRRECFNLLVRLGVCTPDENLLFERYGVPCTWSADVLREADALEDASSECRCDLSSLDAWSIDDSGTRDIDDAISFEHDKGTMRVGIHITDVASHIPVGGVLDWEASQRAISLYLPEGTTPMLPPSLSEKRLSLIAGESRPVVSVFITLDEHGAVGERTLKLSIIRVKRRLSYREVDEDIRSGGFFQDVYERLMRAREIRLADGASGMVLPELQVRVESGRDVVLNVRERETPAQALVAECMILANHSAALFLKHHSVPALYRTQKPGRMPAAAHTAMPLNELLRLRHAFNRTILDTVPRIHAGLGLDCYCSTTSPMRKYLDLVMQRQLAAVLQDLKPVYSADQLRETASALQPVLNRAALVENERRRYWLFKKMESLKGQALQAVIISRRKNNYTVLLTDFLLELNAPAPEHCCYEPGRAVRVLLNDIDPFTGSIDVCLVQDDSRE